MANNQNSEQKPKVSKLPLPVSDSPLVIDLPDGQKIVIGKMTQGSVIEVATWRGVGRPDSRTSRLMLGVGSGNVEEDSSEQTPEQSATRKPQKPSDWRIVLYYIATAINFIQSLPWKKWVSQLQVSIKRKPRTKKSPAAKLESPQERVEEVSTSPDKSTVLSTSVDDDIEAWLNKITEKASAKASPTSSSGKNVAKKAAPVKKTVKKQAKPKAKKR